MIRLLLISLFLVSTAQAQFSRQGEHVSTYYNPTGEPMGGFLGYSEIRTSAEADHVVGTVADFLALSTTYEDDQDFDGTWTTVNPASPAAANDIIYLHSADTLDLTGYRSIDFAQGVEIASNRGASIDSLGTLLYSYSSYESPQNTYVLNLTQDSMVVSGIRLKGGFGWVGTNIGSSADQLGNSAAIGLSGASSRVHNSEVWGFSTYGIHAIDADGHRIDHNYLHHTTRNGFGYPTWIGGSGSIESSDTTIIEANHFAHGKHDVANSGHPHTTITRYNAHMGWPLNQIIDRHSQQNPSVTEIRRSLFFGRTGNIVDSDGLVPEAATILLEGSRITWDRATALDMQEGVGDSGGSFTIDGATFDFDGLGMPQASVSLSASSISEGGSVTITDASTDPYRDLSYIRVRIADTTVYGTQYLLEPGGNVSHTFDAAGRYNVEVIAINDLGIPSEITLEPVTVSPSSGTYVFTGWLAHNFEQDNTGYYEMTVEASVNGGARTELYRKDVGDHPDPIDIDASENIWYHVQEDLETAGLTIAPSDNITVCARIESLSTFDPDNDADAPAEMWFTLDDSYLFGTDWTNGDFENHESQGAGWSHTSDGIDGFGYLGHMALTGYLVPRMRKGLGAAVTTGEFGEICQTATASE